MKKKKKQIKIERIKLKKGQTKEKITDWEDAQQKEWKK